MGNPGGTLALFGMLLEEPFKRFPEMEVRTLQNNWFALENPTKMNDLGVTLFLI